MFVLSTRQSCRYNLAFTVRSMMQYIWNCKFEFLRYESSLSHNVNLSLQKFMSNLRDILWLKDKGKGGKTMQLYICWFPWKSKSQNTNNLWYKNDALIQLYSFLMYSGFIPMISVRLRIIAYKWWMK